MFRSPNPRREQQTADPSKYPQGYFRPKACRWCGEMFSPTAPSQLYCSQACIDDGWSNSYLLKEYGIDLAEYRRLLVTQNFRCAICGGEGFLMREHHWCKLVIDHDHKTGQVRGLLCHNCNRGLGLFHDSPATLVAAADYLKVQRLSVRSTPQANGGGSAQPPKNLLDFSGVKI